MDNFNLNRFIEAQKRDYSKALAEIKAGKKQSHWMWYIFPQIKGLGQSETAQYYSIQSIDEAEEYLENEYLHNNLIEICNELLKLKTNNPIEVMGFPDNLKLCSSMTLFYWVKPEEIIFKQVLNKFYDGKIDDNTIRLCNNTGNNTAFEKAKQIEEQTNQKSYVIKNDVETNDKEHQLKYENKKRYIKEEKTKSGNGIIGFAIGDALGVPAEFKSREELKRNPITDMIGEGTYNTPKGTWSDDTSMTLATMDAIITTKTIDTNSMASNFLKWFRNAEYTANDERFDIGTTTMQALAKYELKLYEASKCGETNEYSNGNGSLMRILPIAYYIYNQGITDNREIYNIVKQVSSITHAHEVSILGCYIYVRYAIELLNKKDKNEAYNTIQQLDYSLFSSETIDKYSRILKNNIQNEKEDNISTSGYVVSTLEAAMWLFLNSNEYNETILKAVNLGEDTDTVAAVAGGLLGIYYGIEKIKSSWKQDLKKYDYIMEICENFDEVTNE